MVAGLLAYALYLGCPSSWLSPAVREKMSQDHFTDGPDKANTRECPWLIVPCGLEHKMGGGLVGLGAVVLGSAGSTEGCSALGQASALFGDSHGKPQAVQSLWA